MAVSSPKKRDRGDVMREMREKAQPILDTLLGLNTPFTEDNVILASKQLYNLNITIDNGDEIVDQLNAMELWLEAQPLPSSRSLSAPRNAALFDIQMKISFAVSTVQSLREQRSLRNRGPVPVGSRGDGNFYLTAVKMGQGDCTLITTPQGRTIIIDCGSDATEGENKTKYNNRVRSVIRDKKFMGSSKTLHILILTHADTDHYNQIPAMLDRDTQIQDIYHSDNIASFSAQGGAKKSISAWLSERVTRSDSIKAVTHNEDNGGMREISINGVDAPPQDDTKEDRVDAQGGLCIVDEPNCKVTILASNVHHVYKDNFNNPINDQSNEKNRGSVVTLIEVFGKKILICGDATRNTEAYLVRQHQARIINLTISQAPHHGSDNTSSGIDFVNVINPTEVLISSGKEVRKDHLPSEATIQRYARKMKRSGFAEIDEHRIFYWSGSSSAGYTPENEFIKRPIFITGSWGSIEKSIEDES